MKIIKLNAALKSLKNSTTRFLCRFRQESNFTSGLIAFRAGKQSDPKQINHDTERAVPGDQGTGRLRANGKKIPLCPGTLCDIPKGTPHDFAAGRSSELVLFYALIKTT
jgi:hypothetical protein